MRDRRLALRLTQSELGDALGVSFQQVQKYEKGANRISASRLRQIAAALDVPVVHFYEAEVGSEGADGLDGAGPVRAADPGLSGEGLRLVRAFGRIADPLLRRRVLDLVESVAAGR